LKQLGFISQVPTIYAIQAENSSALYRAFKKESGQFDFQSSSTVADSICVDIPRNGYHALKRLKDNSGQVVTVTDQQILEAQKLLSSTTGLFAEPAGAAAVAGFLKVKENLNPKATTVILTTGNGLKDISSALKILNVPQQAIKSIQEIGQ
ncbi:MAG: pyridoxal-phosphate dependent enzyme, partial [Pseudomonadota bacterium]